jgi:hypothetical protein
MTSIKMKAITLSLSSVWMGSALAAAQVPAPELSYTALKQQGLDRVEHVEASVSWPLKERTGLQKVWLAPGEIKPLELKINKTDLSFGDISATNWRAEPGRVELMLGSSLSDIRLNTEFNYQGQ